jgi:hypothetical protein
MKNGFPGWPKREKTSSDLVAQANFVAQQLEQRKPVGDAEPNDLVEGFSIQPAPDLKETLDQIAPGRGIEEAT